MIQASVISKNEQAQIYRDALRQKKTININSQTPAPKLTTINAFGGIKPELRRSQTRPGRAKSVL